MVFYHRAIKEVYENMFETKYEKEPYWCSECKRFHDPIRNNQPSITHKEHFCYFSRYKKDFSNTELFNMGIKNSWKRTIKTQEKEKEKEKERTKKPLYIN